jgi:acyl-CoA oxidase
VLHPYLAHSTFVALQDDIYRPNHYLSLMDFRELTLQRLQKFVAQRFFSVTDYLKDPLKFQAALECLSFCDYSFAIKSGAQTPHARRVAPYRWATPRPKHT